MTRNKNGGRRLMTIILIMLFLICVAGGGLLAVHFFMPSFTVDSYYEHVKRGNPDEFTLVYGSDVLPESYYALAFEDDVLLDADFIVDYAIDTAVFWDSDESVLTVSTPLKIIRMRPNEAFYTENGERKRFPVENTALFSENGKVFMPVSFAGEFYQLDYHISRETKTLVVDSRLYAREKAEVRRNAAVRYGPDIKSDIAEKVGKGSEVSVYGEEIDGFYSVRTENGAPGFIKAGDIGEIRSIPAEERKADIAPSPPQYDGKKLSIVWDQIVGGKEREWVSEKLGNVNVVSPTWLSLSRSGGEHDERDALSGDIYIKDVGAVEYAERARGTGYAVWPLMSNSFDADITHEALKSTSKREEIIEELTEILEKYGAEGVNIDFESYRIEDGYYFTQFMKELCVSLRRDGFVTSVDLPVPTLENSPTDREQIGRYVDYVIVMAYDQHWAGSQVKGPVAGYDWVLAGIERTLKLVPAEKVVLGLPLYNRMWYQPEGSAAISSNDFDMGHVTSLFELRNAETVWEENTKYMRGEYQYDIEGVKNTITAWLETVASLRYKAAIVNDLGLKGVACWKKGLEAEGVWEMLAEVIGQ